MTEFDHIKIADHLEPPIHMDGVEYSLVSLRHPFTTVAPTGEDWRLYLVRGDRVVLHAPDLAIGDGLLEKDTVIGMAGNVEHHFSSVASSAEALVEIAWDERPLGAKITPGDVAISVGRIPQSSLPFLSLMGGFIRLSPAEHPSVTARIGTLMDWIAEESLRNDSATGEIVLRLAEVITIEIGRVGRADSVLFSSRPQDADYDERIWRAITAMCNAPQQAWTVDTMARVAGMSRSAFAARYHETVGQTPMRSLRRLRMHRAAMALGSPGFQSIAPLADKLGYGSDAAFNRAFVKEFGYPPKRYGLRKGLR